MVELKEGLAFDDVLLVPQYGVVDSRDDIILSSRLANHYWLSAPIASSPMTSVTEWEMAKAMYEAGGVGFIHRFMSAKEQVEQYKKAAPRDGLVQKSAGCAIGVNEGYDRLNALYDAGCRLFVVDVAHGFSRPVERFMEGLPSCIHHDATFIGGNIVTGEAAQALASWGFDGVRVGIGNGAACTTREKTGHGVPQITALLEAKDALRDCVNRYYERITIMACGGCKSPGDIVKALAAGANSVMLGYMLAGAFEAPLPGQYIGMASYNDKYKEGVSGVLANPTHSVSDIVSSILSGIRSGISYSGAKSIRELQENAKFIRVRHGSISETSVRV